MADLDFETGNPSFGTADLNFETGNLNFETGNPNFGTADLNFETPSRNFETMFRKKRPERRNSFCGKGLVA